MIKLKKIAAAKWNGNGLGNSAADWCVVGNENIVIEKLSMYWIARDTSNGMDRRIARGYSRKDLLEILETKI